MPNATWRASSCAGKRATSRVTGSGACSLQEAQQREEACPRRAPTAGTTRPRSRARRAASAATPARRRSTARVRSRSSSARRVNTSMWRASSATWIASSCITSRKCGCIWPRKRAGTSSAAFSFSIRYVITCTTASSISSGSSNGAVPVDRRCRDPTAPPPPARRAAPRRRPRPRACSTSAKWNAGPPASTVRAARREPPAGLGVAATASGRAAIARRPARRRASGRACALPGVIARQTVGATRRDAPARGTTPRRCTRELRRRAAHAEPLARRQPAQRTLDQQMRAVVEAECLEYR